jgi:tetratricopeptide (TPR) repeat protein
MKIGPIEVTVPMLVYCGGFVFAGVVLMQMWNKNKDIRSESMARDQIMQAMREDANEVTDGAVQSCRSLVEQRPERMNARLFLGTLLYKQKQFKESQKAFDEAAGVSDATAQEKSWALVGSGVAMFASASKESQPKVAAEAAKLFQKALDMDPKCTDAVINLAAVRMYEGGANAAAEAEKFLTQARDMNDFGSIYAAEQFYALSGIVSAQLLRPAESVGAFQKAKTIRPSWKGADDMKRTAMLAAVVQQDVNPNERKKMLETLESQVGKFGKEQDTAYNAIGVGWNYFKDAPDFTAGPFLRAQRGFTKALDFNSKDTRAYLNLAALLEGQILSTAAKLSVPITGFTGETPVTGETPAPNRWRDAEKSPRFPGSEKAVIVELRKLLKEQEDLFKKFIEKSGATPALKMNAKIRMAACARRHAYTLDIDEESQRAGVLNKANLIVKDLLQNFPDAPESHMTAGYLLLDKEEYLNAYNAFVAAQAKGLKSPEVDAIVSVLSAKPEIQDSRPREDRRVYGPKPLVSASLKAMTGSTIKKVTMRLGIKEVPADKLSIYGSQVCYLPIDGDLPDGQNSVSISVTDALNQTVEFPPFVFTVDKQIPSWSVTPENGAQVTTKPTFNITLSDRSGIDFNTLKITWKLLDGKKTTPLKDLVDGGRVKIAMNDLTPPRKIGFPIDNDTFQVSTGGVDIKAGEYELSISVYDLTGNVLSDVKKFTVK